MIALAAFVAAGLTLFSGFGLGTLLMPVAAIFFPIEIAVAITAVVHLANNLFKITLVAAAAHVQTVLRFGLPALLAAFVGAWLLGTLAHLPALAEYTLWGHAVQIEPIKLIIGLLILLFVGLELRPTFNQMSFDRKYLPFGGLLSGFFGGLSGHQGAFRSLFLIKAGLNKEQFIATGVVLAVMVDVARLTVYGVETLAAPQITIDWFLVGVAVAFAFAGSFFGVRLVKKVTYRTVQIIVSVLLALVGLGLASGLL